MFCCRAVTRKFSYIDPNPYFNILISLQMMKHAWDSYRQYGWGHNELKPLAKKGHSTNIFGRSRQTTLSLCSLCPSSVCSHMDPDIYTQTYRNIHTVIPCLIVKVMWMCLHQEAHHFWKSRSTNLAEHASLKCWIRKKIWKCWKHW